MAKIQITNDAGSTVFAEHAFPDAAIPKLQSAFGGGTNPQVAAAVLDWLVPELRQETKRRILTTKADVDQATVTANQVAEKAAFDGAWPG